MPTQLYATHEFLKAQGFQLTSHPAYSPDLAPCDFFLFPKVKDCLRGRQFGSAEEAADAFDGVVDGLSAADWQHCFDSWFERMRRCVQVSREYFEKQ